VPQLEFQVGRKIKNMLSLQIIQFAIEGIVAIRVKRKLLLKYEKSI
jgi:hypothetical protein